MPAPQKRKPEKFLAPYPPKKPFRKPVVRTALVSDILGGTLAKAGTTFERPLVKHTEIFKYIKGLEKKYWRSYKHGNLKLEDESIAFFTERVLRGLGVKDNTAIKRVQEIQKKSNPSLAKIKTPEDRKQVDERAFKSTQRALAGNGLLALKFYMEMYDIMQLVDDLRRKRN